VVGLEADQVVGLLRADPAGDLPLAEAGIERDEAAPQVEPVEEHGRGGRLARGGRYHCLAERDAPSAGVGADQA
jgi:hypothetical protein